MGNSYDEYYKTENLFGEPYPELITFFKKFHKKGRLLDLGCGQGRDAIPLAQLGYNVTGIDESFTGVEQMNSRAQKESLALKGHVGDIYTYEGFAGFDFILLDSMFHFTKNDRQKETDFIKKVLSNTKKEALIVFCIQDTGNKVAILNKIGESNTKINKTAEIPFIYKFSDNETKHTSTTNYKLIAFKAC